MQRDPSSFYSDLRRLLLTWILLSCIVSCCFGDLCKNLAQLTAEEVELNIHKASVPRGGTHAGYYEQDTAANTSAECVMSCCDNVLCNVALYTQKLCFTIECDTENTSACKPVKQLDDKFNDTIMVQVRSLEETTQTDECSLLSHSGCLDNQKCVLDNFMDVTRCRCIKGFEPEGKYSKKCIPITTIATPVKKEKTDDAPATTLATASTSVQTCEYGLRQCPDNQECVPKNSRSKQGTCHCIKGYIMNIDGKCEKSDDGASNKASTSQISPSKDADDTASSRQPDNSSSSSKNHPTTGSTTTTTTAATTTPKVEMLTVSAGDNKEVQLPDDDVSLKAYVLPAETLDNPYQYAWNLEAHPEGAEYGDMEGRNTDTLKLSNLIAGLYTFRVKVTAKNKFGEAEVNVTVKPPARKNQPPVAEINPVNLNMKTTNTAILDGSDSKDDDKIVSYKWEEVSGPLMDKIINGDGTILTLKELAPGNYTFKLTVTDSDGATNSTTANVTVIKEMDYPPKANAGSDVIINLPQNYLVLYGNQSTDDKEIVSYEWTKASSDKQKLAADMQGVRTAELHLSNLEVGDYTFTLKVTDSAGQTSTADVHVYVKPEVNKAPVAVTAGTLENSLPLDSIVLDASNSTDDQQVTSYIWTQTGGPTVLEIKNEDQVVATATGEIKIGKYEFKVTVKDKEELKSSAALVVNIKQVANEAPVARAGGDITIDLPQMFVSLDGSKSTDDHKITDYQWVRESTSLAAGDIVNNSDHLAVLQLVNLVAGRYVFTLTVTDGEGLSSSDKASVLVKEDEREKDLMELVLAANIEEFTEENKKNLEGQLALLLPKSPDEGETKIIIQKLQEDPSTGNLRVIFYAMNIMRDQKVRRNGVQSLKALRRKLISSEFVLDYKVVGIDTLVCQNNCSDHGHCDMKTKKCVCEAFWTQNFILYKMNGESNCDWSILYVVIVCFIIVISITGAIWAISCCWKKRRCRWKLKSKRRHRYSLLQDMDDENENIPMKKGHLKGKIQNSSVMISESDFSSEEETIFVNQKKSNGHLAKLNGVNKQHLKTKLKT